MCKVVTPLTKQASSNFYSWALYFQKMCRKATEQKCSLFSLKSGELKSRSISIKPFPCPLMDPTNACLFLYFHSDSLVAAHCTLKKGCHSSWQTSPMDCFLLSSANYRAACWNAQQLVKTLFVGLNGVRIIQSNQSVLAFRKSALTVSVATFSKTVKIYRATKIWKDWFKMHSAILLTEEIMQKIQTNFCLPFFMWELSHIMLWNELWYILVKL